ncbi:hypothetical protein ABXT66_04635 [Candidatus Levibacter sp. Uisw_134_01]|uniref:hypothetical protein n=1 Tax=Candidatus Levibacter sp. Uisw_134_01 TaxID=3230999 RepID=UPI003D3942CA
MIINNLKSWIKENENKINNLFLYSFKNPMKITEMYKDIDANGTGQSYRDLKKFLNSSYSDIDLTGIEVQIETSESEGIIFFEYKYNKNESYFYSLGKKQVNNFSKEEFFKYLDTGLDQALEKDNWIETFGNRYVTMLSKNELGLLYSDEKVIWEKTVKTNFEKEYEKFQSQPTEWNGGISKLLDLLLKDQLKSLESYEPLTDITFARFEKIKLQSFICEAPEIEQRIPQEKRTSVPDICVYIYAIINVPENDSLDTITTMKINDWITNNIKLIDINSIFEFLTSFPFNFVKNNFCIITTEVIGLNKEDFDKYENKKNLIKENIKIRDDTTFPIDKLAKKNFVELLKKKNITKISFPKKDYSFEDLPIDFVKKCNKLVCALLIKISKNNLNYDFELIKPEFYLIDLCSDFTQYKSLVKSVKVNFDILNEVPEENLLSMKDVYYYIYNHLI